MTIAQINLMPPEQFIVSVGWVFEHSPWVAERACSSRPFASFEELCERMNHTVAEASDEEKLALLRAHPDLGTKAKVSPASASEQAGAGLDQLTPTEYNELTELNTLYREKFGFPFLYAVKGSGKSAILKALQTRMDSVREAEFEEALRQVCRIARFRLESIIES